MNWDAIGAIGEILGAVGVIFTLAYLAVQVRQNTDSLQASSELGLSNRSADWMAMMALNPELATIHDKAAENPDSLTPEEKSRFIWLVAEMFMIFEGHYQLYARGHITEKSWVAKERAMHGFLKNPIIAEWWAARMTPLRDDFVEFVDSRRSQFDQKWRYQSVRGSGIARHHKAGEFDG